jgi:hypothetical protein
MSHVHAKFQVTSGVLQLVGVPAYGVGYIAAVSAVALLSLFDACSLVVLLFGLLLAGSASILVLSRPLRWPNSTAVQCSI